MPESTDLVAEVSPEASAVLRHFDRTAWAVVLDLVLKWPVDVAPNLERLAELAPIVSARLSARGWERGAAPVLMTSAASPPVPALLAPFALRREPPLRVALGEEGRRLVLVGHHAALDGRALVSVAASLLGGAAKGASAPRASARPTGRGASATAWSRLRELAGPADRVAASATPDGEVLVVRPIVVGGTRVTGRVAAACADAVAVHNARLRRPWRRVGVSVAVGGVPGIGNTASYRRIDVRAGTDLVAAVTAAVASSAGPVEFGRTPAVPRWVVPLARRMSDSFLVSNLGRHTLPGVSELRFHPVAKGRSAVAFGLAGLTGGKSTLSLRSLYLSAGDAGALLDDVVARLA